jgi:8-hydroxy-5-deazaflavin:NADPH oxidoreductase
LPQNDLQLHTVTARYWEKLIVTVSRIFRQCFLLRRGITSVQIAILGTGQVSQVLAPAFIALGHEVVVGTRDPHSTAVRSPAFARMLASAGPASLTSFTVAAIGADLVVNAISGPYCVEILHSLRDQIGDTILVDISSPFDFSSDDVVLDPVNTDSLGERVQRTLPNARVVKTLNTLAAPVFVTPASIGNGDHSVFISGNDLPAKDVVSALLRQLGWVDVIDLGDIVTSRATEMMLRVWLDLSKALGTDHFGFKIVR